MPEMINYVAERTPAMFHASNEFVRGLMGPVGCVAPDTLVFTSEGLLPICEINRPMRVLSWNENLKRYQLSLTGGSFPKGRDYLYRVSTQEGEWLAAGHHLVLCGDGKYRRVDTLCQGQTLLQCSSTRTRNIYELLIKFRVGAPHYSKTLANWMGRYAESARLYGQRLLSFGASDPICSPLPICAGISTSHFFRESLHTRLHRWTLRCYKMGFSLLQAARAFFSSRCDEKELYGRIEGIDLPVQLFASNFEHHRIVPESFVYSHSSDITSVSNRPILRVSRTDIKIEYWDLQVLDTNNYVTVDGAIHHNSGKSVACVLEGFRRSMQQAPHNGVRRTRGAVIRNTAPELESTTIKTWKEWIPENVGVFNMKPPISCMINIPLKDGTRMECEVFFIAIDRPVDVKKLLSFEITWAWINEAREVPKAALDALTARVGRYPSNRVGGPTWHGIFMDTNPPEDDHWWYQLAEVEKPKGYKFFRQPGGLIKKGDRYYANPLAENIQNLPGNWQYYFNQVPGKNEDWIKVYILGEYGSIFEGRVVYSEWNEAVHLAKEELEVWRGIPLILGFDFGLTPACAFLQLTPNGQLRVIDELVTQGTTMGITAFGRDIVKPHINNNYGGVDVVTSWGDPAGNQRGQTDETTCLEALASIGIPTGAAKTNSFIARREAVAEPMNRMVGGEPGFLLSPKCSMLRKGFNGRYYYERVQTVGDERFKDAPVKNIWSHVQDALQYGCLMSDGGGVEFRRGRSKKKKVVRAKGSKGWT